MTYEEFIFWTQRFQNFTYTTQIFFFFFPTTQILWALQPTEVIKDSGLWGQARVSKVSGLELLRKSITAL